MKWSRHWEDFLSKLIDLIGVVTTHDFTGSPRPCVPFIRDLGLCIPLEPWAPSTWSFKPHAIYRGFGTMDNPWDHVHPL
jgi:hypothetical protein